MSINRLHLHLCLSFSYFIVQEYGHLSYQCPKNMLGEREPPPKKQRKRKKQDQRYYIVFLCYILSLLSKPVVSTLSFLKLLCNKPQKKKNILV